VINAWGISIIRARARAAPKVYAYDFIYICLAVCEIKNVAYVTVT